MISGVVIRIGNLQVQVLPQWYLYIRGSELPSPINVIESIVNIFCGGLLSLMTNVLSALGIFGG